MINLRKKALSLLLACAMALSLLPVGSFAAAGYTLEDGGTLLRVSASCDVKDLTSEEKAAVTRVVVESGVSAILLNGDSDANPFSGFTNLERFDAQEYAEALAEAKGNENRAAYYAYDGALFTVRSLTTITSALICCPAKKSGALLLPPRTTSVVIGAFADVVSMPSIEADAEDTDNLDSILASLAYFDASIGEKEVRTHLNSNSITVESVSLPETAQVVIGESDTLAAAVTLSEEPEDSALSSSMKAVRWSSDAPDIASVDQNGVVSAHALGTARITAVSRIVPASGEAPSAACAVTVAPRLVSSVELNSDTLTLSLTGTESGTVTGQLTATVLPENATDRTVTWTSSDETVVRVDENGLVTAIGKGEATVTVTANDESRRSDTCAVTVKVLATGVEITPETIELEPEETVQANAVVSPDITSDQSVRWESEDESIAAVDQAGLVTGVAVGNTVVKATTEDGTNITARRAVSVNPVSVKTLTLNKTELTLDIPREETLLATVGPENAANKALTWESDHPDVAEVDQNGKITAKTMGSAVITVRATDGSGMSASCDVTVPEAHVEALTLSHTDIKLRIDAEQESAATQQISVTAVTPPYASYQNITWSITQGEDAVSIAVDPNNSKRVTVTAKESGSAILTASSSHGTGDTSVTATCTVTVEKAAASVAIDEKTLTLSLNGTKTGTLSAAILPALVTDEIVWSSTRPEVVRVDSHAETAIDGGTRSVAALTAVGGGTATITVRCGGRQDSYTLTVAPLAGGITLNEGSLTVEKGDTRQLTATVTPDNAADKSVTWTSSDPAVATVSSSGLVTAVEAGSATVTAKTAGDTYEAVCAVTVTSAISALSLDQNLVTLKLGTGTAADTVTLTATADPKNTTSGPVVWTVSDGTILSVDRETDPIHPVTGKASAVLTAKKPGRAVVSASAGSKTATCEVIVEQSVKTLTLDQSSLTLSLTGTEEDAKGTLTATVTPADGNEGKIRWTVSGSAATLDTSRAETVSNGERSHTVTVTAAAGGIAYVTVSAGELTKQCAVEVPVPAAEIALNKTALTLEKDRTYTLTASVSPTDAADRNVTWSLDPANTDVLELAANGASAVVRAKKTGSATVVVSADGGKNVSARCAVEVSPVSVTGFLTTPQDTEVALGDTAALTASVAPADAANQTIYWHSSNPGVAAVDRLSGLVTACAVGQATVTAQTAEGDFSATCTVTVPNVGATGLTLAPDSVTLYRNGTGGEHPNTAALILTVAPDGTTDTISWRSTNESVATVRGDGAGAVVTAVNGGTASIIAAASSGVTAECDVTVKVLATGIELDQTALTIDADQVGKVKATLFPSNVSDGTVSWTSSSETVRVADGVVSVDPEAAVTQTLSARITASANDGSGKSAVCTVTVNPIPVRGVSVSPNRVSLEAGQTANLNATVTPAEAADQTVTWTSSDENTAVVAAGVVTAKKPGAATITATAGTRSAECYVTVRETPAETLTLSEHTLSIDLQSDSLTRTLRAVITPDNVTDDTVLWSAGESANPVVSVNNGVVTALRPGVASVTAAAKSNAAARDICTVTVTAREVTGVSLAERSVTLDVGETHQLAYTVAPSDAYNKAVLWESGTPSVAEVDAEGKITAKARGTAFITVKTADQSRTDSCFVTVYQSVSGVSLPGDALELTAGERETLTAQISPADASNKNVTWSSGDTSVATVDSNGNVTAVGAGSTRITVTTEDGGKSAGRDITVRAISVTSVSVAPVTVTLKRGAQRNLSVTVLPVTATDRSVTWESSDPSVASVAAQNATTASVTAGSPGTATITVTAADGSGKKAECEVTVRDEVSGVALDRETLPLTLGSTATGTLTATVTPEVADQSVTWRSLNPAVATVDESGNVTAVAPGTATVTATANDGGKSAACTVTVRRPATALAFDETTLALSLTDDTKRSGTLTARLTPADATDPVTWSVTGDDAVLLGTPVTANGASTVTVYAKSGGTATVTAESNGHRAEYEVTISTPTADIELDRYAMTLTKKDTGKLTATVYPVNAAVRTVSWTSSAPAVASVSDDGTVTAKAAGSATVTATAANGQTAQCVVTVSPLPVSSVTLDDASVALTVGGSAPLSCEVLPADADDRSLVWSSSNTSVASVNNQGLVTALSAGTAVITVSADNGRKTDTCSVTVSPVLVETITLGEDALAFNLNSAERSARLSATVLPAAASDKSLDWMSTNTGVVTVDENGVATAVAVGTAKIVATARDGSEISGERQVTVTAPVTGISLSKTELSLSVNATAALSATVAPAFASAADKTVAWSSGNPAVAAVSETGTVTAKTAGTAIITAAAGGKSATCSVTVTVPVAKIELTSAGSPITAYATSVGAASTTLTAVVTGVNGLTPTDNSVLWESSDTSVASVANGVVTAKAAGTATIVARSANGSQSASCRVSVTKLADSVTLSPGTLTMVVGGTETVEAVVSAGASSDAVDWTSSDESVATVSSSGVVRAIGAGTATITATARDGGGASGTCGVTVSTPVSRVKLKSGGSEITSLELDLLNRSTASLTAEYEPAALENVTVSWSSDDTDVVTVDSAGSLTARGGGTAVVTAAVTAGGASKSAECLVTVQKRTLAPVGTTSLVLTPDDPSASVAFAPCAGGTVISLTGDDDSVVQTAGSFSGDTRTYTFTAVDNGSLVVNWSKAEDSTYEAASGSITILSLPQPLTGVSVSAERGVLTASVNQGERRIYVAGYYTGAQPEINLNCTVYPGLTCVSSGSSVLVKYGEKTVCTYAVDRTGVVQLAENVSVSSSVSLVVPESYDGAVSLDTVAVDKNDLKAAAIAQIGTVSDGTDVDFALRVEPSVRTMDSVRSLQLEITPSYTLTTDGVVSESTELHELSSAITISATVNFNVSAVIHQHTAADGSMTVEQIRNVSCVPNGDGTYTVSWQQSQFSTVQLLDAEAAAAISAGELNVVKTAGGLSVSFTARANVPGSREIAVAAYDGDGRMLDLQMQTAALGTPGDTLVTCELSGCEAAETVRVFFPAKGMLPAVKPLVWSAR